MNGAVGLYCDVLVALGFTWVALQIQDRSPKPRPVSSLNQSQTQMTRPVATGLALQCAPGVSLLRTVAMGMPRKLVLSCDIKISTVHCLVLPQSTCLTDGQNYDSQDHASIAASHDKNELNHKSEC